MAFRNITISVEAYEVLRRFQRQGESFTKVILRMGRKVKVADVAGILTEKEASEWEKGIKEVRAHAEVKRWH